MGFPLREADDDDLVVVVVTLQPNVGCRLTLADDVELGTLVLLHPTRLQRKEAAILGHGRIAGLTVDAHGLCALLDSLNLLWRSVGVPKGVVRKSRAQ